jgi:hypothetical protein
MKYKIQPYEYPEIKMLHKLTKSLKFIAGIYKVSTQTVYNILTPQRYKKVKIKRVIRYQKLFAKNRKKC